MILHRGSRCGGEKRGSGTSETALKEYPSAEHGQSQATRWGEFHRVSLDGSHSFGIVARRSAARIVRHVIKLDAATVFLQWSVGGMLGCWFTTRHREVGLGYGWLLRSIYVVMAVSAAYIGFASRSSSTAEMIRNIGAITVAVTATFGLGQSIVRRKETSGSKEFQPSIDLWPVAVGLIALVACGVSDGGNDAVAIVRTVVGAAFLGFVSDAMLLGHWYLVQPGLPRRHVNEIVRMFLFIWPLEVVVMLIPTGMFSVFTGSVDDGWSGQLGWFWGACAITTGVLGVVTLKALQERSYSAVMAATGLMYLAILTSFGTDLVARAVLAG